jgi:hypothetical protein
LAEVFGAPVAVNTADAAPAIVASRWLTTLSQSWTTCSRRHKLLEAVGKGTKTDGVLGHPGRDGYDLPTLTVEETRAQAYLKSPQQMWRTFAQLPAALEASVEIAERCRFRLPLRRNKLSGNPDSR